MTHKLNNNWNIWYHKDYYDWTIKGFETIYKMKTLEDYFTFFDNIDILGDFSLIPYYIMKENNIPIWENNLNGGEWSIKINYKNINQIKELYKDLVEKVINEEITIKQGLVFGISISNKNNISIIKIWIHNDKDNDINNIIEEIRTKYNIIYNSYSKKYKKISYHKI